VGVPEDVDAVPPEAVPADVPLEAPDVGAAAVPDVELGNSDEVLPVTPAPPHAVSTAMHEASPADASMRFT
jgi:hypothetical protein